MGFGNFFRSMIGGGMNLRNGPNPLGPGGGLGGGGAWMDKAQMLGGALQGVGQYMQNRDQMGMERDRLALQREQWEAERSDKSQRDEEYQEYLRRARGF